MGKEGESMQYLHITGDDILTDQPLIHVNGGTLVMWNAQISNNKWNGSANANTSGVLVENGGTFTMYDGLINGNSDKLNGGAVEVSGAGSHFTMNGGSLENNSVDVVSNGSGGHVYAGDDGIFTMNGGTISNKGGTPGPQAAYGAGVAVPGGTGAGKFIKNGGTIYGLSNPQHQYDLSASLGGNAVHFGGLSGSPKEKRDATLGPDEDLNTEGTGPGTNWDQ